LAQILLLPTDVPELKHWNLRNLFVDPSMQRQGLGKGLLQSVVRDCKGKSPKGAIWLNSAPEAVTFYLRNGFKLRESTQTLPAGFVALERSL
jgi:GNAT superfamily N-acetyltransferase